MTINELLQEIEQFNNADKLPKYIVASDISDSQIKLDSEWENVIYAWGICKKVDKFVYFETDDERGYVSYSRNFSDEKSAAQYAYDTLKIINDSLNNNSPNDMAVRYIVNNYKYSKKRAEKMVMQMASHIDIFEEFLNYMRIRKFRKKDRSQTQVEGYTAERLCNEFNLSPLGAYNYLIYLKENPNQALADLKSGLPRK